MHNKILGALTLAVGSVTLAHATMPDITVSYINPTGVVSASDSIEMWVRITSDRQIGTSLGSPFGFDAADLPKTGSAYDPASNEWKTQAFASYTSISLIPGYGCTPTCDVPGYTFTTPGWARPDSFFSLSGSTLSTGDFLVGTFTPTGSAAPGTYLFQLIPDIQFNVQGLSASGLSLNASFGMKGVYAACTYPTLGSCGFTRTVAAAVPEPHSLAYGLFGLVVAAGVHRRRRLR